MGSCGPRHRRAEPAIAETDGEPHRRLANPCPFLAMKFVLKIDSNSHRSLSLQTSNVAAQFIWSFVR